MPTTASRLLTALVLIAGLMAVAVVFRPDWVGAPRAAASPGASSLITGPDERLMALAKRMRSKAQVVWQLLDGDLSLFDAAAAFRFLNDYPTTLKDNSWHRLPGKSDGEKLCRQVISWAESHLLLKRGEAEVADLVSRWERELEEHIARNGTVDLGLTD